MFLNNDILLTWGNLRFQSHLTPYPMSLRTVAVTLEAGHQSDLGTHISAASIKADAFKII